MSDDLLKEATQALRDEAAEASPGGNFTRARVLASLHQTRVKRRTLVMPLVALSAAATAWGAANGALPRIVAVISQALGSKASQEAVTSKRTFHGPSGSVRVHSPANPSVSVSSRSPAQVAPTVQAAPVVVDVAIPRELTAKQQRELARSTALKATPNSGSRAVFSDADGDLYRSAHTKHFAERDYASALVAWDEYLQATPNGRLTLEARYNRSLCLLRLGREAEARTALEPFASGKLGYREKEARELLEELAAGAPKP